jgi:hypothetical protein
MLNRIAIFCLGLFFACLLALGYLWLKRKQVSAEVTKNTALFVAEERAQKDGLEALGNVDLGLSDLSFEGLQGKLHQPDMRRSGARNTTTIGWACGTDRCAVRASFLVPFGQDIPPDMMPAALIVAGPIFTHVHRFAVGGIYLGETVSEMEKTCQDRGYTIEPAMNRISLDKDWKIILGNMSGRISLISLANEKMMKSFETSAKGTPSEN